MVVPLEIENSVGHLTIDDPERPVNVLNETVMGEFEAQLDELESESLDGLTVESGKPENFVAGADLEVLRGVDDEARAHELSRQGQRIFQRFANLPFPTICLIHGDCLGGGLELALACDYRIVSDDPATELGCPEVKLGIIPGWGGTQRLPELIGLKSSLRPLLTGSSLSARKAVSLGLADKQIQREHMRREAHDWIRTDQFPTQSGSDWSNWPLVRNYVLKQARKQTLDRTRGNMPAPLGIIDVLRQSLGKSIEEGLKLEAEEFASLVATPECRNLIRVFFLRQNQKQFSLDDAEPVEPVDRVGVIGAGTMGAGIAQWVSSRDLPIALVDIDETALTKGMNTIDELFRRGVDSGALTERDHRQGMRRIRPGTEYELFSGCDVVVEAVVEELDVKNSVLDRLDEHRKTTSIVASNTSALSIREMARRLDEPGDMVGLHFFNPVYRMQLVEVVNGKGTSAQTLNRAVEFTKRIGKIPVVVKDSPGFLVNRILVPYLNEAGQLLAEHHSIESIDETLKDFGMPMGPIRLIDEVGIDVGHHVASYLIDELETPYRLAEPLRKIHADGLKGANRGGGFYQYRDDREVPNRTYDSDAEPTTDPEDITRRLIDLMVAEAVRCLQEGVVGSADELDAAMILGTGFAPFRGGLLAHADQYGLDRIVEELEAFRDRYGDPYRVPERLREQADTGRRFTDPNGPR